jgi:hypothetical protein
MLKFYADSFLRAMQSLIELHRILDQAQTGGIFLDEKGFFLLKEEVRRLCDQLYEMGLTMSHMTAEKIKTALEEPSRGDLKGYLVELLSRVHDELGMHLFFLIQKEKAQLYEPKSPAFGKAVEQKLVSISGDIAEAGKCLCVGRYTASVFHLMRIMEVGVQKFGEKIGVPLADEKNWQHILDETNKAIKGLPKNGLKVKYSAIAAHLYNVKVAWRNEVMHPKATYTEEEAQSIFNHVKSFMSDLAGVV